MGVSKSPEELAAKLQRTAALIPGASEDAVKASVIVYKNGVLAAAKSDVGGDMRMRWSGRNLKLGARYKTYSRGGGAFAILTPRPAGVWSVLSNGTAAHEIHAGARNPKRKRRNGKRVMTVGAGFATKVNHPGTPGKRTWQKGVKAAERPARSASSTAFGRTIGKVFR